MRVVVTGHNSYIGSVMVSLLRAAGHEVAGLDTFYFEDCVLGEETVSIPVIRRDIRDVTVEDLIGFDAVVHLAALCNDPLGDLNADWTFDINHRASVHLARVAKEAGAWRWETSLAARSPGFEINDLGFQTRTDFLWLHGNVQRRWTEPTEHYRYLQATLGAQNRTNFDGDLEERQLHASAYAELPNYWEISSYNQVRPQAFDPRATRGGPVVKAPAHGFHSLYLATDSRRRFVGSIEPTYTWTEEGDRDYAVYLNLTYKPASNIALTVGPSFEHTESAAQYVTTVEDATAEAFYGNRYVFSDLEQGTVSLDTRLDWTFTPTMSLELFLQPFFSSNDFSRFKEFAAPRTLDKLVYGEDMGTIELADGVYTVDPDAAGPAETFTFDDPNFSFSSLRGNLVYRWEYLPGSTLFLVWTQNRSTDEAQGDFDLGRDFSNLWSTGSDNVFLAKLTYWFGI